MFRGLTKGVEGILISDLTHWGSVRVVKIFVTELSNRKSKIAILM
jgi:hypothetical protein